MAVLVETAAAGRRPARIGAHHPRLRWPLDGAEAVAIEPANRPWLYAGVRRRPGAGGGDGHHALRRQRERRAHGEHHCGRQPMIMPESLQCDLLIVTLLSVVQDQPGEALSPLR